MEEAEGSLLGAATSDTHVPSIPTSTTNSTINTLPNSLATSITTWTRIATGIDPDQGLRVGEDPGLDRTRGRGPGAEGEVAVGAGAGAEPEAGVEPGVGVEGEQGVEGEAGAGAGAEAEAEAEVKAGRVREGGNRDVRDRGPDPSRGRENCRRDRQGVIQGQIRANENVRGGQRRELL